jgi:hypothetical protein
MRTYIIAALSFLVFLPVGGCSTSDCGPGTVQENDPCVPIAAPTCALGTKEVDGACVKDPDATELVCDSDSEGHLGSAFVEGDLCKGKIAGKGNTAQAILTVTTPDQAAAVLDGLLASSPTYIGARMLDAETGNSYVWGGAASNNSDATKLWIDGTRFAAIANPGPAAGSFVASGLTLYLAIDDQALKLVDATLTFAVTSSLQAELPATGATLTGTITRANAEALPVGGGTLADALDAANVPQSGGDQWVITFGINFDTTFFVF